MDYYGTAMHSGFPMAVIDLSVVESASDSELIRIVERENFDLSEYDIG